MINILSAKDYKPKRARQGTAPASVTASVTEIIANVIERGDDALREYSAKFDGCDIDTFELAPSALDAAIREVGPEFVGIMERAAHNIEDFHRKQIRHGFMTTPGGGVVLGQRILPIERVGLYIPGGTAAYPSSVLMNCIPAKLAGVGEIIIVTPPSKGGGADAGILAALKIVGVEKIFTVGGAQAIAALAYGTDSIPRVDKIFGPGNAYVAEAKRQVFGDVGIDMIAGPSDILVIADNKADAALVAADMLSQCEHGEDSAAILITDSLMLANAVADEIELQLKSLPREEIARTSVDNNGMIIVADSLSQAFNLSNTIAPEHLEIFLDEPLQYLDKVKNAGSIFLGKHTPEALGDYYAGPNHTLPTSGTARFTSPLSVDDFIKKSSFSFYTMQALSDAGSDIITFAGKEGLKAHALSVAKRL